MRWIERAEQQIEEEFENGFIDQAEYMSQMRDLQCEVEAAAEEAAEEARRNFYY